jgi:undecaprenyl-diphosphatase
MIMNILEAFLLGIIQGITEFLPVSSSGHMSLFTHFAGIESQTAGLFSAMLHIGTLVAILIVFYKPIYELFTEFLLVIKDIFAKKFTFNFKKMSTTRRMLFMFVISCVPLLVLLVPIGGGRNIMDAVGVFGSDDSIKAEGICFMFTGFLLLLGSFTAEKTRKFHGITASNALLIGIAQFFAACFPGISRSGSTISTGMICGVSKENMVEYSFILGIPAIMVANVVELKDAVESGAELEILPTLIGVIVAAVVGVACIKLLQWILKKDMWKYFGYYCLVLGAVTVVCSAFGL